MESDPLRHLNDHAANFSLAVRALHQYMQAHIPRRPTHRVAFAREPGGVRAVCTDCCGQGWGPTVEAARAAILADLRRLEAERQPEADPPDLWEETLALDEDTPP